MLSSIDSEQDTVHLLTEQNKLLEQLLKQGNPKSHFIRNVLILLFVCFVGVQLLKRPNTSTSTSTSTMDTAPLGGVHYIAGSTTTEAGNTLHIGDRFDQYYYGRDYIRPQGSPIYAPYDGILSFQSDIGGYTPQLTISNDKDEKLHIMHLDAIITSGFVEECTLIGTTAANGAYSNNTPHEHASFYVDGLLSDWEYSGYTYEGCDTPQITTDTYYGQLRGCTINGERTVCKMSHYVPALGGINGDDDPTRTGSGASVAMLLRSDTLYCAAPQDYPFDSVIVIDGIGECIKQDNGGWILRVEPGQSDPACVNALAEGNTTACDGQIINHTGETYNWIDVLQ